jgi:hypothetical protein
MIEPERRLRKSPALSAALVALALLPAPAASIVAQEQPDTTPGPQEVELIGELMAFHGTRTIVSVMTTHCFETAGLDLAYKAAADNWYLRNIGFLDLADRVIEHLGGAGQGQRETAVTYAGSQIMSAYNAAPQKDRFCREFLEKVDSGGFDIDKALPEVLAEAQAIATQ